jgi:asparagine synthase (glutamine-hydrolysing)
MSRLLRHRGPDDEGMVLCDLRGGQWLTLGGADTPVGSYASPTTYAPGRSRGDQSRAHFGLALLHRRLAILDLSATGHQPLSDESGSTWITYNGEVYNYVELKQELEQLGERFVSTSDTEVILAAYRRWGTDSLDRLNGCSRSRSGTLRNAGCSARGIASAKPLYYQYDGRRFVRIRAARA